MTEVTQLPFTLNQAQIDAAIAKELPALLEGNKIDYTHGRPPRGLTGTVIISEDSIRNAVIAHARKLVNPMFKHFSVDFTATRGEDGMTANIIASTHAFEPEAPSAPRTPASPAARPQAAASAAAAVEVSQDESQTLSEDEEAPFEGGEDDTAVTGTAEPEQEEGAEQAEKPVRSRLFGNLARPTNAPAE